MALKSQPVWDTDVKLPSFPKLRKSIDVDVAIIGGGLTGLNCAYFLSKSKLKVALLEKNTIGTGATGVTTAFLTRSLDTDTSDLIRMYGKAQTRKILMAHQDAIENYDSIINDEDIECEFLRCSNFIYATKAKDIETLKEEERAIKSLGLKARFKRDDSLKIKNHGYLEITRQAKFHPLKYLAAITKIVKERGVAIFENTEVKGFKVNNEYVIETSSQRITARSIIIATYAPFDNELKYKKAWYETYILEAQIPKNSLPEGIYEDTENPYHYFRVDKKPKRDRLIIGGEDHRSDIPVNKTKNFRALRDYLNKTFKDIDYKLVREWSGPIIEPIDGLAYIGPSDDENVFYATGFSGNGMTYAMIAARNITSTILKQPFPDHFKVYDSLRTPTTKQLAIKGKDFTEEFARGAVRNTLKYSKNRVVRKILP